MLRIVLAAALLAALLLPIFATPVAAFPLQNCSLDVTSMDANGQVIDEAHSGAADATLVDPLKVDWGGTVSYESPSGTVITDAAYQLNVFNIPTPVGGTNANNGGDDSQGSLAVGASAPFQVAGLYYVSGSYAGEGGTCTGSGWIQLLGNPIGTAPWLTGAGMAVVGILGLVAGLRGHRITSVLGGLLLGIGSALLLISHSLLPLAEFTPLIAALIGVAIGFAAAQAGRGRLRGGAAGETPADPTTPPSAPLAEA
jgi:hypothetical protein